MPDPLDRIPPQPSPPPDSLQAETLGLPPVRGREALFAAARVEEAGSAYDALAARHASVLEQAEVVAEDLIDSRRAGEDATAVGLQAWLDQLCAEARDVEERSQSVWAGYMAAAQDYARLAARRLDQL